VIAVHIEINKSRLSLQSIIVLILAYMVIRLIVDKNYIADFEAYCPFGGMQALTSFFVSNSLACSMTESQIFMGIVLLAGVIIASKLFCSFICPIGTFTEWLGKIGDRLKMRYTITGLADRLLRVGKYALLFITFYFSVKTSELFCKEYDPFYAIFTWFGHDVNVLYAIIALAITILGAIFIRQFWCKYLCPLGAAANIFVYAEVVAVITILYFLLRYLGLELGWMWLIGGVIAVGMIMEIIKMQGWNLPYFKITRDPHLCTDCKKCDIACPMAINISEALEIKHIDCHMCGDCITACPEKKVMQINRKETRWLPSTVTVLLVVIGVVLASTLELPTINKRWGTEDQFSRARIYEQSGLKNVKCFGSASSFASKMRRVQGVLGVEAYVKTNTVKIYFDPEQTKANNVIESIFTPSKTILRRPKTEHVSVIQITIDKLFDTYDTFYLTRLLNGAEGIFGFETRFGEPVQATIFFDDQQETPGSIRELIESDEVTYTMRDKPFTVPLRFEAEVISDSVSQISPSEFMARIFQSYRLEFNGYADYDSTALSVYRLPMPQAMDQRYKRQYQFLAAHISMDSAITCFETVYDKIPYAQIHFVDSKIEPQAIFHLLSQNTLTFMYSNGKTGKSKNPFRFPKEGIVIKE